MPFRPRERPSVHLLVAQALNSMTHVEPTPLERVLRHCEMAVWGHRRAPVLVLGDEVGAQFIQFAGLHLLSTMFLTRDGHDDRCPGFVRKVLVDEGLGELASPIDGVLRETLGGQQFGELIRLCRNKLATHGTLSASDLPAAIGALRGRTDSTTADEVMDRLIDRVEELAEQLRNRIRS